MSKILNCIRFIFTNIMRLIISPILSFFIKRDKNILLFNGIIYGNSTSFKENNVFLHNTKYLFLYLNFYQTEFKTYWLCSDKKMIKTFQSKGYYNVLYRKSLKAIYYCLKAKYYFYDYSHLPVVYLLNNAILINLWHGTGGLKKALADDNKNYFKSNKFIMSLFYLLKVKTNYFPVDSDNQRKYRISSFKTTDDTIITTGTPRIDGLYHYFKDEDMFIEEDYNYIQNLKEQGKKLFLYTPTFRETGKDVSNWFKSNKLKSFLTNNNAVLICKLHPADKNFLDFDLGNEFYKMNSTSDIYPIFKFSDAMIADYSSIYFDYLNLDKPVIHFVPDLKEFEESCRELYEPYETTAVGPITKTEDELINEMLNVLNNVDNYKTDRKKIRDELFTYQDGKNCERIIEFIRGLNKK